MSKTALCSENSEGIAAKEVECSPTFDKTLAAMQRLLDRKGVNMKPTPSNPKAGRILVPVDFSECSRSAVDYAVTLAKRFGSEVFLVHVVEPYLGTGDLLLDMARMQAGLEKNAKAELEQWAKGFQPSPQVFVRSGSPAHQILETAKEIGASTIVIPSHGRSAVARFFIGGVAERVVRHASCPVIVLPWKKRPGASRNPFSEPERSNRRRSAAELTEVL